ncbi:hypothetical protein GO988_15545 [Hymenobacter sp. HMF4947]|uniref:Uncharacterized protein n=1 Tax=Hymenobacter ginkgonis TaxID=2682976 RepID=A0A7K1TH43_9BACT|nr:hypothetical protein [Hymenobacter ginkgonis]MVN77747.1 hypothetical protein [Hymenobacter ginkgonis]
MATAAKDQKQKAPPIGFGRTPTVIEPDPFDEAPDPVEDPPESDIPLPPPPLAQPIFVGEMARYELFARYDIRPLAPTSVFEMQLIQIIAGLEKRVRELDPDL